MMELSGRTTYRSTQWAATHNAPSHQHCVRNSLNSALKYTMWISKTWLKPQRLVLCVVCLCALVSTISFQFLLKNTMYMEAASVRFCPVKTSYNNDDEPILARDISRTYQRVTVAMVLALTTRGLSSKYTPTVRQMPLFQSLMTSFCDTCSSGYHYPFFVAYDIDDLCMLNETFLDAITQEFRNHTASHCPRSSTYTIEYLHCNHSRHVAWAQNDAMMLAHASDADYMYRVNDDTVFESGKWTELFIHSLKSFTPPNVGIVGPMHKNGNQRCLTYEFVHRTHMDILGFHYPRNFTDWDADMWITAVYQPGRVIKLRNVSLLHTMQFGMRYTSHQLVPIHLRELVSNYRDIIARYVERTEAGTSRSEALTVRATGARVPQRMSA